MCTHTVSRECTRVLQMWHGARANVLCSGEGKLPLKFLLQFFAIIFLQQTQFPGLSEVV